MNNNFVWCCTPWSLLYYFLSSKRHIPCVAAVSILSWVLAALLLAVSLRMIFNDFQFHKCFWQHMVLSVRRGWTHIEIVESFGRWSCAVQRLPFVLRGRLLVYLLGLCRDSVLLVQGFLRRSLLFIFFQSIFASYNKSVFQTATSVRMDIRHKWPFLLYWCCWPLLVNRLPRVYFTRKIHIAKILHWGTLANSCYLQKFIDSWIFTILHDPLVADHLHIFLMLWGS